MGRASWLATATVLLGRVSRVTSPRFTIFSRFESQNGFQMMFACTAILGFLPSSIFQQPWVANHISTENCGVGDYCTGLPARNCPKRKPWLATVLHYPHRKGLYGK